jgi:uncharacterized glyoxalase superfamily protein PhnB
MSVSTQVPQKLYAVSVEAKDVKQQRAFYEAWGWQAKPYSTDEYVAFDLAGSVVAFFKQGLLGAEAAPGEMADAGWRGFRLAVNVPNRDDVNGVYEAAVAAGARAIGKPEDQPWGGRSGFLADPEGNRWEIAWVPAELLNA